MRSPHTHTHTHTHIHTHTPPPPLPLIGREMLLRIAELVPKHPGRHRKGPPAKSDGGGGGGGAGTSTGGGGGGSSKKGGKKKKSKPFSRTACPARHTVELEKSSFKAPRVEPPLSHTTLST